MNKDQVSGRVESVKGAVKKAAGHAVGNDRLAAEGAVQETGGKVQSSVGDAKAKAGNAIKKTIDR